MCDEGTGRMLVCVFVQVCIQYNPAAEGTYCLPLFLRIKDGKQLQLQLSAQAVAPSAQLALAVRGSHSCQLAAAPIGELQPPLQQYTLRNAGPAPLQYRCACHCSRYVKWSTATQTSFDLNFYMHNWLAVAQVE
jgi:hypothetical protein